MLSGKMDCMDPKLPSGQPASPEQGAAADAASEALQGTLGGLRDILHRLEFVHQLQPDTADPDRLRQQIINQINDYLLPRSRDVGAPLLAVVGGSTGAGKSTLVNSLIGEAVTRSGAVRPTTRTPVLIHHPQDAPWFDGERILPSLTRLKGSGFDATQALQRSDALLLVAHEAIPKGLALLDAPDIDSVSDENRKLSGQLLNAADLWIFVTTANRYSDAVPWTLLQKAGERGVTVCVVLNRVPAGAEQQILPELEALLESRSLDPALLQPIAEVPLGPAGLIPANQIEDLLQWLQALAASTAERQRLAAQTLRGALEQLVLDLDTVRRAAAEQDAQVGDLQELTERRFEQALDKTLDSLHDGSLLRGEILARWQDFVGAGELMRGIEGTIGRMRDKVAGFLTGKPPAMRKVETAIETGLHTVLVNEITRACQDVDRQWIASALGTELLLETSSPRPPANLPEQSSQTIRAWQGDVLEMIRTEGAGKRKTARLAAFGVNGIAVALMVVVFASTAGLTGLEVGIAGGSAVVGQKVLEAIFGEDAVRRMAARASVMLEGRCRELIEGNQQVYTAVTGQVLQQSVAVELDAQVRGLSNQEGVA